MAAVPNETGQEAEKSISGEACGRCGARIDQDVEICAACGALLSAYRTPMVTADEVPVPTDAIITGSSLADPVRTEPLPRTPFRMPANVPPEPESRSATIDEPPPDLSEARAELLTTMLSPERRLVSAIQAEVLPALPVVPPATPAPANRKAAALAPVMAPAQRPAKPTIQRSDENRPRKPGFVAIGSIEPVVMIGSAIFVVAVIVGLLSSFGLIRFGSVVALALGAVGISTIIFAMLVALVRKDQDRR